MAAVSEDLAQNPAKSHRRLIALILGSAVITLDGTATTIALPAIGRDLSASMVRLQWIANAPLLALAALLLPAGTVADRFGRLRVMRTGLLIFVAASFACAAAWSGPAMIGAKMAQGVGGALVLPAALAMLREIHADPAERTRIFGMWAAWTGAATAVGPLLAGALVDTLSWRAVFLPTSAAGLVSFMLLTRDSRAARAEKARLRDPHRQKLFLRELLNSHNCVPANAVTFALYFGMFGLSFLLALYVQQVLHHSALWAAIVLLPISIMLLFAERFGRLATMVGTQGLVMSGSLAAAGGIAWIGTAAHPVPFWSHIIVGTALFGLGTSVAVSALTNAAVAAIPEKCAGAASGLNHAVVRAAGLAAVALLGAVASPGASDAISPEGFTRAVLLCATVVAAGGLAGSARLRDDTAGGVPSRSQPAGDLPADV